ncbi:MAG: hypothetical protein MUC36_23560 [Planctomycetes bacterium]|nr:hypothetical protein [Planctomycetota bacterium]
MLLPVAMAQQTIRVPDQAATIEAAIAMAADGDRILLTAASYQIPDTGLLLTKSLVIEAVGDNRAVIDYPDSSSWAQPASPALRITGLGSQGRVVLRNLTFTGGYSIWAQSTVRSAVVVVQLPSGTGELVMQGVHAIGETRHQNEACPGLRIDTGPGVDVLLRDCRFEGANGRSPFFAGGGDIEYHGSPGAVGFCAGVLLAECSQFVGGAGGSAPALFGGQGRRGGDAARLQAAQSALKNCDLVEGTGGSAYVYGPWSQTDPCPAYGAPGQYVTTAELYDCVRTVVPQGCGQTVQYWPLQVGRNDVECIPPATVGVPFRFKVRAEAAGLGFTMLLVGSRVGALEVPGIAGLLRLEDPAGVGILAPSTPTSWTDVWVGSVPATLGWLPTIAVQPLHLDSNGLRFGSFATFTVR